MADLAPFPLPLAHPARVLKGACWTSYNHHASFFFRSFLSVVPFTSYSPHLNKSCKISASRGIHFGSVST